MKRMLMAVAALGLAAGAVRADWGGPAAPGHGAAPVPQIGGPNTLLGPSEPFNGVAPDPYGLHPRLKKLFRLNGAPKSQYYPQMGYTQSGPAYNPTGYPPGAYGPAQGTLVFPHHPFVRSPRDFFMLDANK
ncbi:MAG: hypothetical protein J0I06_01040 [Planctomycetes bacterium]|nr:hypothetical protein [Planctomycetota bacterium]